MAAVLVFLLSSLFFYFIYHLWNLYTYWRRKGIAGPTPLPIVGNYGPVLFGFKGEAELLKNIYDNYPNDRYVGIFQGLTPVLILREPEVIKKMLVDDFDVFGERYVTSVIKRFDKSLFVMKGNERWKVIRASLMPMFTKLKLKNMVQAMKPALAKYLEFVDYLEENKIEYEFRALEVKFSLESIVGILTGTELDNFRNESKIQNISMKTIHLEIIGVIRTIDMINSHLLAPFIVGYSKETYKIFEEFFYSVMKNRPRRKSEEFETILDIFLEMKETGKISKKIGNQIVETDFSDDDIIQLSATICLAGLESVSSSISLLMHELARDQNLQNKCFKEIKTAFDKSDGEVTVESLSELKYLGMAVDEIYRKTTVSFIDRKCGSKYRLPDTDITIDEDVYVYVPLQGLHYDPKYFPNPDVFDPERFSSENMDKIPSYVYMPFGVGPRQCLGKTLGKMMTMTAIAVFLYKYKIVPSKLTSDEIIFNPVTKTKTAKSGIWATILRRDS